MIPTLEVNGKTYEFKVDFTIKRMYDKDVQNLVIQRLNESKENYTPQEIIELNSFIEKIEKEEITQEDILKNKDLQERMARYLDILYTLDAFQVNSEYVFKMLNKNYKMKRDEYEQFLIDLEEEYGSDNAERAINEICNAVFTTSVEKEAKTKKSLPSWMTKR